MTNNLEITEIEKTAADDGRRFLQSTFWAEFKGAHGWQPHFFEVKGSEGESFKLSVLVRTFKKALFHFSIAYIPLADVVRFVGEKADSSLMESLAKSLKPKLPHDTMCVRFDPAGDFFSIEEKNKRVEELLLSSAMLKKTSVDIQPPDTVLLDITKSEDDLLSSMKNKWRYNIRLAERKGVVVKAVSAKDADFDKELDAFYSLYQTTASRDGIGVHPKAYYRDLLERGSAGDIRVTLYIASHEDEPLAAIVVLFCKAEAVYLYGCSGNHKRNLMPAYLLQWTAIRDAKAFGSPCYDFYGCPPDDDENHPMHGLFLFKTGFGGVLIHRLGSFDAVLNGAVYGAYRFAENARAFYHKKLMKKIRGR